MLLNAACCCLSHSSLSFLKLICVSFSNIYLHSLQVLSEMISSFMYVGVGVSAYTSSISHFSCQKAQHSVLRIGIVENRMYFNIIKTTIFALVPLCLSLLFSGFPISCSSYIWISKIENDRSADSLESLDHQP